jgi:hypothetical protein
MQLSGTVQRIFNNTVRGKSLYSFTLRGKDGFINLGGNAPTFKEGDQVAFDADPAQKPGNFTNVKNVVVGADTPVTNYSPPFQQRSNGAVRSAASMTKEQYWERKEERDIETQKRIQLQAARNTAIAYLTLSNAIEPIPDAETLESAFSDLVDEFVETPTTPVEEVVNAPNGTDEWS